VVCVGRAQTARDGKRKETAAYPGIRQLLGSAVENLRCQARAVLKERQHLHHLQRWQTPATAMRVRLQKCWFS